MENDSLRALLGQFNTETALLEAAASNLSGGRLRLAVEVFKHGDPGMVQAFLSRTLMVLGGDLAAGPKDGGIGPGIFNQRIGRLIEMDKTVHQGRGCENGELVEALLRLRDKDPDMFLEMTEVMQMQHLLRLDRVDFRVCDAQRAAQYLRNVSSKLGMAVESPQRWKAHDFWLGNIGILTEDTREVMSMISERSNDLRDNLDWCDVYESLFGEDESVSGNFIKAMEELASVDVTEAVWILEQIDHRSCYGEAY